MNLCPDGLGSLWVPPGPLLYHDRNEQPTPIEQPALIGNQRPSEPCARHGAMTQ